MKSAGNDLTLPQLFLDDHWIDYSYNAHRVWHKARKYTDPILRADRPWEYKSFHPCAFGTVLDQGGTFRMWYMSSGYVCYAESADGIHWTKPELGLHEVDGNRNNNIVLKHDYIDNISVIEDFEDEEWPLKALYWSNKGAGDRAGICAVRSRDGIRWDNLGCVLDWGDRFNAVSQRINGQFMILGRDPEISKNTRKGRIVARAVSEDLMRWSKPQLVLAVDLEDALYTQYYSATAFPYGDMIIGSIERMYMCPDLLDTEIIWSRDGGITWQRAAGRPRFIELGPKYSWDSVWINLTSNCPIVRKNRLCFFYSGRSVAHTDLDLQYQASIGVATLRIDGFCSIHAASKLGEIVTRPMTWPGGDLLLNCDCRHDIDSHPTNAVSGEIRVEVRGEDGSAIPGYTFDDFPFTAINTAVNAGSYGVIRWKEDRGLSSLKGKRIRLCMRLRDAHLYAFKAGEAPR